ncbi:hypothetical protein HDU91_005339 [Kappamyces sp. JEL0680]|nr:hypothetical protein HDU91_005339 [Kappamyces sp. JEL0680]
MAGKKLAKRAAEKPEKEVKIYLPDDESDNEVDLALETTANDEPGETGSDNAADSDGELDTEAAMIMLEGLPRVDAARQQSSAKEMSSKESTVVYLGRIPHGFYEDEMRSYFTQFGQVKRLRLSRNKKTGASKHYAFIEFENAEVARIVAETMNNYLLSNRLLKCQVIEPSRIHHKLFVGANRKYRPLPWHKMEQQIRNRLKSPEEYAAQIERLKQSDINKKRKLEEVGIDYDFEGYSGAGLKAEPSPKKPKDKTETADAPTKTPAAKKAKGKKETVEAEPEAKTATTVKGKKETVEAPTETLAAKKAKGKKETVEAQPEAKTATTVKGKKETVETPTETVATKKKTTKPKKAEHTPTESKDQPDKPTKDDSVAVPTKQAAAEKPAKKTAQAETAKVAKKKAGSKKLK